MTSRYEAAYRRSLADPEGFWAEAAEVVHWDRRWDNVLDDCRSAIHSLVRGRDVNTCYNALDRHVERAAATSRR